MKASTVQKKVFALVDCNNFYASCERLFRPELAGRPVVVLSNNDGCIVARSNEAKALGIGMGSPYFKYAALIRHHKVTVFSSNYALYGDLSQRVMDILTQIEPEIEIYSIDEAFIPLPKGKYIDLMDYALTLKATVHRYAGIPVSIGLGSTKTLAKIANRLAKKDPAAQGILDISGHKDLDALLADLEVKDIWGIGRKHAARLKDHGIHTALALKNCNDTWLKKTLTITGLRTAMELRGISCIPLEETVPDKKSIATSRSFGRPIESLALLQEAVSSYVTQAAFKLRNAKLTTNAIHVFLRTNSFKKEQQQYSASRTFTLATPTSHTPTLIRAALKSLQAIYRPGHLYHKAGVLLTGLVSKKYEQLHIFEPPDPRNTCLMETMDKINSRWGRDTIHPAATGFGKAWDHRQLKKSPAYTTKWTDLPTVKASFP
jgi:DNA polymerase V